MQNKATNRKKLKHQHVFLWIEDFLIASFMVFKLMQFKNLPSIKKHIDVSISYDL